MQSGVFALVVVDVDGDFLNQAERLAVGGFDAFQVGGKNVIGFADGNPLGEFSHVVGINFPLGFFVFGAANFYGNAIHGMIVRAPDGAGDESVGLAFGLRGGEEFLMRAEGRREKYDQDHTQSGQLNE